MILFPKYILFTVEPQQLEPDVSFTMVHSNPFLSLYEILPIAPENKYLGKVSYFIMKLYVVFTHENRLINYCVEVRKVALNYRHLLPGLAP